MDPAALRDAVRALFESSGVPDGDAALVADALVASELRGVTTHGVANLGPRYLEWVRNGFANPSPKWHVTRGSTSVMNVDGDRGLGVVVAAQVMTAAIERAGDSGICMATIHNSRHLGMAAYHAMLALDHGMIGVCTTTVRPSMVPTWGREPRLGTNPIAVAVPTGRRPAFVFDAAMTTVASNKIRLASQAGEPVAPGLLVDNDGHALRDAVVPREPFWMTPLGGTPEGASHKGYGLAAAVDILSAVLSQASFGARFERGVAAHNLIAVDVEAFQPLDAFRSAMDEFVDMLTSTPPARGHHEVLVAGLREHRATEENLRLGIALPAECHTWLERSAAEAGLPALDLLRPRRA